MAFIEETGTVIPKANAYGNVAGADEYHTDLGNQDWVVADEATKTACLIKATRFIDGKYRNRWKGLKVSNLQPLCWPRVGVDLNDAPSNWILTNGYFRGTLPNNVIPDRLKAAVYEAARIALTTDLEPTLQGSIAVQAVAGVATTTYKQGQTPGQVVIQVIKHLISDLIEDGCELLRS